MENYSRKRFGNRRLGLWCPELPGCASAGITEEEAVQNIRKAIQLYLEPAPLELSPGAFTREVTV